MSHSTKTKWRAGLKRAANREAMGFFWSQHQLKLLRKRIRKLSSKALELLIECAGASHSERGLIAYLAEAELLAREEETDRWLPE